MLPPREKASSHESWSAVVDLMHYRTKQSMVLGSTLGFGLLAFALAPTLAKALPPWDEAQVGLRWMAFMIFAFGYYGVAVIGSVCGAIAGMVIALLLPGQNTLCPQCKSQRALGADRSPFTGRRLPNRCGDCGHTW
jgi:predicted Zn finger-like uncharacterized protein